MPVVTADAAGTWRLGDRTVNRMGFGSMRITVDPDRDRAVGVVRRAVELGVDHIDTAAFYVSPGGTLDLGEGPARYATELIREALAPYPAEQVLIATKVGPGYRDGDAWGEATTPAQLRAQVEENLRRLGRDHLDLVNLRIMRRSAPTALADRFGVLADLCQQGLIRHLGLSNVGLEHVDEAQAIAAVVCVQNGYSVDHNRADDALVRALGERGIAFVPFFAIAGGRREAGASGEHGPALQEIARTYDVTPHQVRLAWTLHQGPHVLAIPGTGNPDHVAQNIAAGALRLTPEDLALLG